MINLWPSCNYKYLLAKKRINDYLADDFYKSALQSVDSNMLSEYNVSNSLKKTILFAKAGKTTLLLTVAMAILIKRKFKSINPFKSCKLFK